MSRGARGVMRLLVRAVLAGLCCLLPGLPHAHTLPLSHVELRAGDDGIDAVVEAPAIDFAHDLPSVTPDVLLTEAGLRAQKDALFAILATRLVLVADGQPLAGALVDAVALEERRHVRMRVHFAAPAAAGIGGRLRIGSRLFPYDVRHKTYLDLYRHGTLVRQVVFDDGTRQVDDVAAAGRDTAAVVRQFVAEGVHHIFVGPDHILFVVGLLLLGGTLLQLLKITTAFTVAHSLTLALATLGIVTPPAGVVEPAIALSIVFVGIDALAADRSRRDLRLAFAFGFGLVHGFGFASVLREMELPRAALGWSLFSFNAGVEIGQGCIVLTLAPLLALVKGHSAVASARLVTACSFVVVGAGAFWFAQRLFDGS